MIWSYYIYVFVNLKLHDILGHINGHVSCLQKMQISFNYVFLHYGFCVSLLDVVSMVAKTTKILVRITYFKSIVSHIKNK